METSDRVYTAAVITAFGSVTKLARALGESISTVHSWKRVGRIPRWWFPVIERAATDAGLNVPQRPTAGSSSAPKLADPQGAASPESEVA